MDFFSTRSITLTYQDILDHVSKNETVYQNHNAKDFTDFILNVVTALIHDKHIILRDFRNIEQKEASEKIGVAPILIKTVDALIHKIQSSKSQIGIYSSGTTATPKLIYQSINRLLKSVKISDEYKNSKWGFTYNPSHSAGIQVFLQAICNQATMYDLYKYSRNEILATLLDKKITHLSATPTFYRMLAPYDFVLENLRSITFNGEKSTPNLIENIKSIAPNARIRNIYGSTESGPLMSSESTEFKIPERLIGNIKIENEELFIKENLVSKSVDVSGWYPTGDLVKVVQRDPLTIEFISRKTRIINVGGHNVNPQEVEEVLLLHSLVQDARVFGRPNKLIGNLIVAEVQLMKNKSLNEKELIDFCKLKLASYKVPRMIKIVNSISVGRTGKKAI